MIGKNSKAFWSPEPIIGYRFSPPIYDFPDSPARCRIALVHIDQPTHKAPDPGCSCGYYAFKTPALVERHQPHSAIYQVELFGLVIEHELGYRAERILVAGLTRPELCLKPMVSDLEILDVLDPAGTLDDRWRWPKAKTLREIREALGLCTCKSRRLRAGLDRLEKQGILEKPGGTRSLWFRVDNPIPNLSVPVGRKEESATS